MAVASLVAVTIVSALGMSIPNVSLPLISDDFAVSVSATQWVSLSFLLFSSLLMVPAGRLADSVGRVKVLLIGVVVFTIGSLLAGFATSLVFLSLARAAMGAGGAAMSALPVALVRQTVSPAKTGRTMGLIGSSMAAGWALGPAVGGALSAAMGWRWVFFGLVPLGVAAFVLVVRALPISGPTDREPVRMDWVGSAVLTLALVSYSVGLTLRPGGAWGTAGLVAFGALSLVAFVFVELRVRNPLVNFPLLAKVSVYPGLATAFIASTIMMTFTVIPPFYLTRGLGLDPTHQGMAMAVGPTVAILSGVPAGRLVEKFGSRPIFITGLALLTVASVGFTVLPPLLGLVGFLLCAVSLTPGNQMFMASNNTNVMARAGVEHQGSVAGVLNLLRNLGSITGVAVSAALFDAAADRVPGPEGATLGLQVAFAVAALLGVIGLAIALLTGRPRKGQSSRAPRNGIG